MSNKLKRNNSLEDNSLKTGKGGGKRKSNKGNSTTRTLPKRHTRNPRRALWEEFKRLSLNKVPWIIGGDFNTILHNHENQGGIISSLGSIEDFNDMVFDSGLTDAGFEGEPFTWTNKRHMWNMHHNFQDMVKQSWGAPIQGYVDQVKTAAYEAEKQFDRLPSEVNLTNLNRQNVALVHALKLESKFWRQKSNCKWLEAGERNTKFFHASFKKKRLKSKISRESAVHFFESLLSDTHATSLQPDFPFQFPEIHQDVLLNLCQPPSQDDIKEVVLSIDKDSVAGPDGFSSAFFQACWNTIVEDVNAVVMEFFRGTPMPRSFSATSIILIPKNDSPQSWSEFRPISLCNSGFVPGRLIADNILLSQEMTHHLDMIHNKGNLFLKLDMSKAYDRVNWKFLYVILEKMSFPSRFIVLIKHAIEHCWFTILVNGEPLGFFKSSQGLRQGDPIFPALFILAAEALSRGLNHLFSQNPDMFYQTGCKTRVSHLAYADDIIIFTRF
ncbi:UNVERIFIED_CONTAM: hypothetical protein Sindi_1262600 [Sesamum indicum]